MTRGNAINNMPPAATSHTSCHDHNGPIAAITCRRSGSDCVTNICNAPAPKLRPSSIAYTVNMNQKMMNHASTMSCLGPLIYFGARREKGKASPEQSTGLRSRRV